MDDLQAAYEALQPDASQEQIKLTAEALQRRQYMPVMILGVKDFFLFTREDMLREFDRVQNLDDNSGELKSVIALSSPQEVREKHLLTLLNQYTLLCGLRKSDGDAWALVNELYEDD